MTPSWPAACPSDVSLLPDRGPLTRSEKNRRGAGEDAAKHGPLHASSHAHATSRRRPTRRTLGPDSLPAEEVRAGVDHVGSRVLGQHDVEVLEAEEDPAKDVHVDAVERPVAEREDQGVEVHEELGHGGGRSPIVPALDLLELVE